MKYLKYFEKCHLEQASLFTNDLIERKNVKLKILKMHLLKTRVYVCFPYRASATNSKFETSF